MYYEVRYFRKYESTFVLSYERKYESTSGSTVRVCSYDLSVPFLLNARNSFSKREEQKNEPRRKYEPLRAPVGRVSQSEAVVPASDWSAGGASARDRRAHGHATRPRATRIVF